MTVVLVVDRERARVVELAAADNGRAVRRAAVQFLHTVYGLVVTDCDVFPQPGGWVVRVRTEKAGEPKKC